jgi:hypothetical protein
MGVGFTRTQLIGNINSAFHADNIAATAGSVAHLPGDADAFDIVHALGLFNLPSAEALVAYRAGLGIPPLNQAILALAFKTAVADKVPLNFAIVSGHAEQVSVSASDKLISVVLTRVD